jgi:hypothetical protein
MAETPKAWPWLRRERGFYQAKLLRRAVRRMRQVLRYGRASLAGSPVFFANSFPKSGTHLLTQVLQGLPRIGPAVDCGLPAIVTFEGDTGRQRPVAEILGDFQRLAHGDIAYGHVHALPEVVATLCQDGFATYFILRDPRDVVLSHVHYVTEMAPDHIHHPFYCEVLKDFDERLYASIQGVRDTRVPEGATPEISPVPTELPDIRSRFEPFMGWLDHPEVLAVHFEDFITNRRLAIEKVLDFAIQRGFRPTKKGDHAIDTLSEGIDPSRSPTFRSGKIGGWHEAFSEGHKQVFKQVTDDLLVRLGYERDDNW